jgi:hypothetical protein
LKREVSKLMKAMLCDAFERMPTTETLPDPPRG